MKTSTFVGHIDINGHVISHTHAGVTFVDMTTHLIAYRGTCARVTIEEVPQVAQYECDKCKTAFNVDLRNSPPTCCGNLVPVVTVNDPTTPPTGGNWYWASDLCRWKKMADDDIVFTNEEYERMCKAVQPYSTDEDVGLQADQVIANVVARLARTGMPQPPFVVGEHVRWPSDGASKSGFVSKVDGSIVTVQALDGQWKFGPPYTGLTSAGRPPTAAPKAFDPASLKGDERVQWKRDNGELVRGQFKYRKENGSLIVVADNGLFWEVAPDALKIREFALEGEVPAPASPPVPPPEKAVLTPMVPARCTKHDTAVKCRHCHLEEAHRRAFDGAYVGEGK